MTTTNPELASVALRAAEPRAPASGTGLTPSLLIVYVAWILVLFEPDWFLAGTIGGPFYRIPTVLMPILVLLIARQGGSRAIYWPFALFLLLHVESTFTAENRGYAFVSFKFLLQVFLPCTAIVAFSDTPARIETMLKLILLSFVWYGVQGIPDGRVDWHPLMANEDSYGPMMVMAIGFAYFFALATPSRFWKWLAYATTALGVVGLVASFARGAVLSGLLVLFVVWLRSPHKVRALLGGLAASVIALIAIQVLFPEGEFWAEMETVSEGTEAGTGQTRWIMWKMAVELFKESPILGVGASNFGVVASQVIPDDPSRPEFRDTALLYNAALHNLYFQVLSEEGLAGVLVWAYMIVDFFRRTRRMRGGPARERWSRGGRLDLACISHGLEAAMVGFLATAFFYNQLYINWFWTLVTAAFAVGLVTQAAPPAPGEPSPDTSPRVRRSA